MVPPTGWHLRNTICSLNYSNFYISRMIVPVERIVVYGYTMHDQANILIVEKNCETRSCTNHDVGVATIFE